VGDFALQRASILNSQLSTLNSPLPRIGRILHPSPASPAANRDWAAVATRQLVELGVWKGSGS
jgi:single-strand selective monofunctional uracil DNA glycosylase